MVLRSKGRRSRSWGIDDWKWFPDHNWLCNPPIIMKLHTRAPYESSMCPFDFWVTGKGHGVLMNENGFWAISDFVIHLWAWNFIHLLPMGQRYALLILRSKGQGHGNWLLKMVSTPWLTMLFTYHYETSYTCFQWVKHVPHWFGVKSSKVKFILYKNYDDWKWFPDLTWLCNPPMIMKLHTLAPHESRMCPFDFGV